MNKPNSTYKLNLEGRWSYLEGKSRDLMIQFTLIITKGTLWQDGHIYHNKRLTHRDQGKIEGYASCLLEISYLLDD